MCRATIIAINVLAEIFVYYTLVNPPTFHERQTRDVKPSGFAMGEERRERELQLTGGGSVAAQSSPMVIIVADIVWPYLRIIVAFVRQSRLHRMTERWSAGSADERKLYRCDAARKQLNRAAENVISAPRLRRYIWRLSNIPLSVSSRGVQFPRGDSRINSILWPEARKLYESLRISGLTAECTLQGLHTFTFKPQLRQTQDNVTGSNIKSIAR